jgi:acetyl-CoA synthetase
MKSEGNQVVGSLCIKSPYLEIYRYHLGDHQRYKDTYFSQFPGNSLRRCIRDEAIIELLVVDDVVIVSGHIRNSSIEDSINEHPTVAESAIVGFLHEVKGNALYGL